MFFFKFCNYEVPCAIDYRYTLAFFNLTRQEHASCPHNTIIVRLKTTPMSKEQDQIFLQNFIIILVMLMGMIAIFVIIARTVGTNEVVIAKQRALVIADETRPVASVRLSTATTAGPASGQTAVAATDTGSDAAEDVDPGKRIHDALCLSCHSTGLAGIPQTGKVDDWVERIAQGNLLLYERAINGYTGETGMVMPPRGGNASLSDDEVKAAVDYMIEVSQ